MLINVMLIKKEVQVRRLFKYIYLTKHLNGHYKLPTTWRQDL